MTRHLHVEDNEDNVYLMTRKLSCKGYDVIVASDGGLDVEMTQREHPSAYTHGIERLN